MINLAAHETPGKEGGIWAQPSSGNWLGGMNWFMRGRERMGGGILQVNG